MQTNPGKTSISDLQSFYRLQARVYDLSRWSFLFGRRHLLEKVISMHKSESILEVGCGTGTNLAYLARRVPDARLSGVDLSVDMLRIAERKMRPWQTRVRLQHGAFDASTVTRQYDLVLFAYSLSMMNPGWDAAIDLACRQLQAGGLIAVVDFDTSPSALYRRYMQACHVRVDGHLLPALVQKFSVVYESRQPAYAGLWRYFMFIGRSAAG